MRGPASILTFVLLVVLLAVSIGASRLSLGPFQTPVVLTLTVAQGALVLVNFMRARLKSRLIWLAAGFAFVWLGILFTLALSDYLTRGMRW